MWKIKNQIILFYFGLTRKTDKKDLIHLSTLLDNLLSHLKTKLYECDDTVEIDIYVSYFILLYKLIAYTRDIQGGKGERDLTYMMIDIWYKHFPILSKNMLKIIPKHYGSWKDLKYFCKYTKNEFHQIEDCIQIWNNQLEKDMYLSTSSSNVSKWIPREKSAFGWLFEKSALEWYLRTNIHPVNMNPIKKEYRQIVSLWNQTINPPQIQQTQGKWSQIVPENISVTTKSKQHDTFLNTNHLSKDKERIQCKWNFEKYYLQNQNQNQNTQTHLHSFHLGEYIKHPHLQNQKYWNNIKTDILQSRKGEKIYMLPIVNISIQNREEYNNAIGIACMISEISAIRDRILLYDQYTSWINTTSLSLKEKIERIREKTIIKGTSNILNAIELIQPEPNIISIIISDFSMEPLDLYRKIIEKFAPNKCPKIVYWNIGSKIPFFSVEDINHEPILVSGSSSSTLKYIYQNIEKMTDTYSYLHDLVNQERYKKVEDYFKKKIMKEE